MLWQGQEEDAGGSKRVWQKKRVYMSYDEKGSAGGWKHRPEEIGREEGVGPSGMGGRLKRRKADVEGPG